MFIRLSIYKSYTVTKLSRWFTEKLGRTGDIFSPTKSNSKFWDTLCSKTWRFSITEFQRGRSSKRKGQWIFLLYLRNFFSQNNGVFEFISRLYQFIELLIVFCPLPSDFINRMVVLFFWFLPVVNKTSISVIDK